MLLRAAGAGGGVGEVVLVLALAVLPSASDAIAADLPPPGPHEYGPHRGGDGAGTAAAMAGGRRGVRRRLLVQAVRRARPCWRCSAPRRHGGTGPGSGPAVGVVALGIVPFYVVAPVATVRAMTAVLRGGRRRREDPHRDRAPGHLGENKLEIARGRPHRGGRGGGRSGRRWRRRALCCRRRRSSGWRWRAWRLRLVFEIAPAQLLLAGRGR